MLLSHNAINRVGLYADTYINFFYVLGFYVETFLLILPALAPLLKSKPYYRSSTLANVETPLGVCYYESKQRNQITIEQ